MAARSLHKKMLQLYCARQKVGEDAWDWADRLQNLADEAYALGVPRESIDRDATLKFICGLTDKEAQDYLLGLSHKKRDSISSALKRYHAYVQPKPHKRRRNKEECYTKHTPSGSHNWYETHGHCSESSESQSPPPQPHIRQRRSDDCYAKYASSETHETRTCDSSDCRSPSQSWSNKSKNPPAQPQRDRKKITPCAVNYSPSVDSRLHNLESSVTQLNRKMDSVMQILEAQINEQKQSNKALLDALGQISYQPHRSHSPVSHKLRARSASKESEVRSIQRQEIVSAEKIKERESSEKLQLTVACSLERYEPTDVLGTSAKGYEAQTETKNPESNGPITQSHINVHASTELIRGLLAQEHILSNGQNMLSEHQIKATSKTNSFEIVDANRTWDPGIRLHLLVLLQL